MKTHDKISLTIAGHEIRLNVEPGESDEVTRIANEVSERIQQLSEKLTTASQAKVAVMVAFELACQLSDANVLLDEAEKLHAELETNKQAITRLECLLEKVDEALLA